MSNCPNCGAPIIAPVCDYCGTRHYGFEQVPGHPAQKVAQLLDNGLITVNEAREMLGYPRRSRLQECAMEAAAVLRKSYSIHRELEHDLTEIKRLMKELEEV